MKSVFIKGGFLKVNHLPLPSLIRVFDYSYAISEIEYSNLAVYSSNERESIFVTRMYSNPVNDVINLEMNGAMEDDEVVQVKNFDRKCVKL
jgi:hypothetical protein